MVRRWLMTLTAAAATAAAARANFYFLLPADGPKPVRVVFNSTPRRNPDTSADAAKTAPFTAAKPGEKPTPAQVEAGPAGSCIVAADPAAEVYGVVTHGVGVRGQSDPALVVHQAYLQPDARKPGTAAADGLTLRAVVNGSGVVFTATLDGKPAAVDLLVQGPGDKRPAVVGTAADGTTRPFAGKGRYAVRTHVIEKKAGEYKGRPYQQVRRYATLVAVVPAE